MILLLEFSLGKHPDLAMDFEVFFDDLTSFFDKKSTGKKRIKVEGVWRECWARI